MREQYLECSEKLASTRTRANDLEREAADFRTQINQRFLSEARARQQLMTRFNQPPSTHPDPATTQRDQQPLTSLRSIGRARPATAPQSSSSRDQPRRNTIHTIPTVIETSEAITATGESTILHRQLSFSSIHSQEQQPHVTTPPDNEQHLKRQSSSLFGAHQDETELEHIQSFQTKAEDHQP